MDKTHAKTYSNPFACNALLYRVYPWIVWTLGATFFFYKYLLQVSPSVMSAELMRAFHVTGAGLGNLAACYFYAYLLMQIPVGILLDKYSPRLLTALAIFICAASTFLFAHVHTLWLASIARALIGLSAAFAAVSCFKFATVWFPPNRFAYVAGLSMTAAMLGAIGGEAPLSILVEHFGWRTALEYTALPGFILMLLFWLLVRDKPVPASSIASTAAPSISVFKALVVILKDPQTWLLSFYSGLAFAPVSVFGGLWGVPFLQQAYHLSATMAATAVSCIFIGFAVGCPLAGWFSDYIGRRVVIMAVGTTLALLAVIGVLYLPNGFDSALDFLLFSFGLGASCFFLCFSMVREINSLLFVATVLGFMNMFDSICEAVSEPFIGKLLDIGWHGETIDGARVFSVHDYHLALSVLPLYLSIALILLFFIKETYCKQIDKEKF